MEHLREKGSLDLIKQNLGITPEVVLDPTLLIDKSYYLNLVNKNSNEIYNNEKFILIYLLGFDYKLKAFIRNFARKINYKIITFRLNNLVNMEDFIYYINNCQAVLTNSFHGTLFSIIFNKPFLTFYAKDQAVERFKSLGQLFNITNRLKVYGEDADVTLLNRSLNINYSLIDELRVKSLNFLKKNLDIK